MLYCPERVIIMAVKSTAASCNCNKNNGNSYYRVTKTIGYGKRKDFYGKTKKDALKKYEEYKVEHTAPNVDYSNMKFGALFEFWLYQVKRLDSIKPATFARYDTTYRNHIRKSRLTNIPIYKLKSIDLQLFVNDQIAKGISPANVKNTFKVVKMFVHFLFDEEAITRDYSKSVKLPRSFKIHDRIRVFTPEEKQIISEHLYECPYPFILQLGMASGMRLGEMLALKYDDFSSTGVSVNKTLSCSYVINGVDDRVRKKMVIPPKTETSIRFIPLPDSVFQALAIHKYRHNMIMQGNHAYHGGYCFTKPDGELHDLTSVNKSIKKFFIKCGMPNHSAHDLRHTYISSLVEAGVEISTVKDLAGHSDISMTLRYTHINEDMKRRAVLNSASFITL